MSDTSQNNGPTPDPAHSPDESPQVFAISRDKSGWVLTRRGFIAAGAAAAAGVAATLGHADRVRGADGDPADDNDRPEPVKPQPAARAQNVFAHHSAVTALVVRGNVRRDNGPDDFDKNTLISAGSDGRIKIWQMPDGALVRVIGHKPGECHGEGINALAISPTGRVLASGGADNKVMLWSLSEDVPPAVTRLGSLSAPARPDAPHDEFAHDVTALAFSPNGLLLAAGTLDGTVRVWSIPRELPAGADWLNGVKVACDLPKAHAQAVTGLAFPTNDTLGSASTDHASVKLWAMPGGARKPDPADGIPAVGALAAAPVHKMLIAAASDSTVRLWTIGEKTVEKRLAKHNRPLRAVNASPDGTLLLSGGDDNLCWLWDLASDNIPLVSLVGHSGPIRSTVVSADRRWLATGSDDRTIRIWSHDGALRGYLMDLASCPKETVGIQYTLKDRKGNDVIYTVAPPAMVPPKVNYVTVAGTWTPPPTWTAPPPPEPAERWPTSIAGDGYGNDRSGLQGHGKRRDGSSGTTTSYSGGSTGTGTGGGYSYSYSYHYWYPN